MSIKSEKTLQVFEKEVEGTKLTLTVDPDSPVASFSLMSAEIGTSYPLRLEDVALFAEFFAAVGDDLAS